MDVPYPASNASFPEEYKSCFSALRYRLLAPHILGSRELFAKGRINTTFMKENNTEHGSQRISSHERLEDIRARLFVPRIEVVGTSEGKDAYSGPTSVFDVCYELRGLVSLQREVSEQGNKEAELPEVKDLVNNFGDGLKAIAEDFAKGDARLRLSDSQRILFVNSVERFAQRILTVTPGEIGKLRDEMYERLLSFYIFLEACRSARTF